MEKFLLIELAATVVLLLFHYYFPGGRMLDERPFVARKAIPIAVVLGGAWAAWKLCGWGYALAGFPVSVVLWWTADVAVSGKGAARVALQIFKRLAGADLSSGNVKDYLRGRASDELLWALTACRGMLKYEQDALVLKRTREIDEALTAELKQRKFRGKAID